MQLLDLCQKSFLHLIVVLEEFELISGADTTYHFNTGTSETFCSNCGIHAFYVPGSDADKIDVNVRCLEGVDPAALTMHRFDGQKLRERHRRASAVEVGR
jgi:hypothetical protein